MAIEPPKCGNSRIFLQRKFYVKSIFIVVLEHQEGSFLTNLEALKFDFGEFVESFEVTIIDFT